MQLVDRHVEQAQEVPEVSALHVGQRVELDQAAGPPAEALKGGVHLDHGHAGARPRALVLALPRDPRVQRAQLLAQRPHLDNKQQRGRSGGHLHGQTAALGQQQLRAPAGQPWVPGQYAGRRYPVDALRKRGAGGLESRRRRADSPRGLLEFSTDRKADLMG
jgi:hypothetical protein